MPVLSRLSGHLEALQTTLFPPIFKYLEKLYRPTPVLIGEEVMAVDSTLALVIVVTGGTGIEELFVVVGLASDGRTPIILALFTDFEYAEFPLIALIDNVGNVLGLLIKRVRQAHS